MIITKAEMSDLDDILELQYIAYQSEALLYEDFNIQPLKQTMEQIKKEFEEWIFYKAMINGRIIGSIRVLIKDKICFVGKLIVNPEYQNQGIGTKLMRKVEESISNIKTIELYTGNKSIRNLYLYKKLGFKEFKVEKINENLSLIYLRKEIGGEVNTFPDTC